jgi:Putative metallopeptidase
MAKFWTSAAFVVAAAIATPVAAQELTEEQQAIAVEFALNNSIFVLQHEIGHLFVREFDLPVLGKEEDAADSLASVMLLSQGNETSQQALRDAADGWYLSEYSKGDEYEDSDFYDEHSLDLQRSYAVVCLMVGADPDTFGDTAVEYEMDADRQEGCAYDYQLAVDSWVQLLEPHAVKDGKTGASINFSYEADPDYQDISDYLQQQQFLETGAQSVVNNYVLPRELKFVAKKCGEPNAMYNEEEAQMTFCYEMFVLFFNLLEQDMLANPGT